MPRID
ncbi:hypothetical protein VCHC57A1_1605, partial [Vibrio cholerae HC-57A1]